MVLMDTFAKPSIHEARANGEAGEEEAGAGAGAGVVMVVAERGKGEGKRRFLQMGIGVTNVESGRVYAARGDEQGSP